MLRVSAAPATLNLMQAFACSLQSDTNVWMDCICENSAILVGYNREIFIPKEIHRFYYFLSLQIFFYRFLLFFFKKDIRERTTVPPRWAMYDMPRSGPMTSSTGIDQLDYEL